MAELRYPSFDLRIRPAVGGYLARGRDSYGREAKADFRVPFSEAEVEGFRRRLGLGRPQASRHAAGPDAAGGGPADLEAWDDAPKIYGGKLFEALFQGELLNSFHLSLEQAQREKAGLRIRLRLAEVPELADLPWEYLYDRRSNRFFALSATTPVVRYLELPEPYRPLAVRPPLEMLVMIASPGDHAELDAEQEWRRLNEALDDLRRRGAIRLERLEGGTLAALQRRLRRGATHVFHFVGHGEFDRRSQQGRLILEDEAGRGAPVGAEDLGMALYDHAPRLVVLNACDSARASRHNPFAGVAQTLIRQGVPAVVAMQTEVLDDFALTFAHELYGALADGYPVDACLAEARKLLAGQRRAEWGTPVLYLRAPDGRILDFEEPDAGGTGATSSVGSAPIQTRSVAGPAATWPAGGGEKTDSERASRDARSRLAKWAGVAALVVAVLLLLKYGPWPTREAVESTASRPAEAETSQEIATGNVPPPAAEDAGAAAAADDRGIEGSETTRIEARTERSETPGPAKLVSPEDRETEPKATVEPSSAPAPAPAWPRGGVGQVPRRNEKDGQYYVWIPAGSFRFGCSLGDDECEDDEKPAADEEVGRGFWLGRTEVTVRAYRRFQSHPSLPPAPSFNPGWQDEAQPMVNVSGTQAAAFCAWAASRLPTEVEWEYAARADEKRARPRGDLSDWAWFDRNSEGRAQAVSQREPNAFGLYDMLGNVSEWVAPGLETTADVWALRGGSWINPERFLRFSFRLERSPGERDEMFGFRCLAEAEPP